MKGNLEVMIKRIVFLLRGVKKIVYCYYFDSVNRITFKRQDVTIRGKAIIVGKIFVSNRGTISIGASFRANSGYNKNPIGGDTILRLICMKNAKLMIGDNVSMSNSTILAKTSIVLEDNVMMGGSCRIWDTDFHSMDYTIRGTEYDIGLSKPILVRKNAFIGAGVIILKGVTIGENSIIAAGSVVSKSVPSNEVWGGNPAKFIRKL